MQEFTKKEILSGEVNLQGIIEEQRKSSNTDFCKMISELLTSRNQVQIFHWQTKGPGSYAEHKAYEGYYDEIPGKLDGIVESYQGKYGIIMDYTCGGVKNYKNKESSIRYFEKLLKMISNNRSSVKDSYLLNQVDEIEELINSTLYKLKFLG
jgi:DNA-binding ferritin-like protein